METDREVREQIIKECLAEIRQSNPTENAIAGLEILHKLINNILKNPKEEKFRILKRTNKAIQAKLMSLSPCERVTQLLSALGYEEVDAEISAFTGNYFAVLSHGAFLIDEAAMELKMLTMPEDERKKQELILQNRRDYLAKMKADAEYKKMLEENSMKDRKEKAKEKARDSVPNKLKFGANMVKFEPPKESRGG